jgi:hypothetical protein
MDLPIIYHQDYIAPLPPGHRFPMSKFGQLYELLLTGRQQKSSPNVVQTGLIKRKHVLIPVEPINK